MKVESLHNAHMIDESLNDPRRDGVAPLAPDTHKHESRIARHDIYPEVSVKTEDRKRISALPSQEASGNEEDPVDIVDDTPTSSEYVAKRAK